MKKIAHILGIIGALVLIISPIAVHAQWSGPSQAPTGGNTSAPVNVGTTAQVKNGGLSVNAFTAWLDSYFAGKVGIGTVSPAYKLDVNGDVINNGWYRSQGATGWYSESYGGGWYMQDSTWIRSYGSKPVYMSNGLDTGAASGIGCGGGLGGSYILQVCGSAGVGAAAFYYTSDSSLKKDIVNLDGSLEKVLKLQGVSFSWKEDGSKNIGVIAQDVEKIYPELVNTDKKTGLKSVEYGNLVAPLIEAIKEQQKQIDELRVEIDSLKSFR